MINLNDMKFNNFKEFFEKRQIMKIYYIYLTKKQKREYKNYIYNLNFKSCHKDRIWEYFNEPILSPYYVYDEELIEIGKLYGANKSNF